jgi:hypothetical protein
VATAVPHQQPQLHPRLRDKDALVARDAAATRHLVFASRRIHA